MVPVVVARRQMKPSEESRCYKGIWDWLPSVRMKGPIADEGIIAENARSTLFSLPSSAFASREVQGWLPHDTNALPAY